MAGEAEEAKVAAVEFRCENCGAPWTMRGFQTTRSLACESCGSIFDTSGEKWELVQKVEGAYKTKPRYALGTRGKLNGVEWEVIGWAKRSVRVYGTRYSWEEHLLFNPYEGFQYLVYQDGHFVLIETLPGAASSGVNMAGYQGQSYKHFSSAEATVDEVLGEFPWEMRRGDTATATDYIDPPYILSLEESKGEAVWSRGKYMPRKQIFAALGQPSRPCGSMAGIHPCQPNPHRALSKWMLMAGCVALLLWVGLTFMYLMFRDNEVLWAGKVLPTGVSVPVKISEKSTVELSGSAYGLSNNWVFVEGALIDTVQEGQGIFMGLELSYYHGYSGGESWSEGSRSGSTLMKGVPEGEYLLQLQSSKNSKYKGSVDVSVIRDVRLYRYSCCTLFLLLFVPIFVGWRVYSFEKSRWAESDHG